MYVITNKHGEVVWDSLLETIDDAIGGAKQLLNINPRVQLEIYEVGARAVSVHCNVSYPVVTE